MFQLFIGIEGGYAKKSLFWLLVVEAHVYIGVVGTWIFVSFTLLLV